MLLRYMGIVAWEPDVAQEQGYVISAAFHGIAAVNNDSAHLISMPLHCVSSKRVTDVREALLMMLLQTAVTIPGSHPYGRWKEKGAGGCSHCCCGRFS